MQIRLGAFLLGVALPAFSLSLSDMPRAYPAPGLNSQLDAERFVVADLDLDGKSDVVVDGLEGAVLYGRGDGSFDTGPTFVAGGWQSSYTPHSVIADLDGDRYPDIVANDYRSVPFRVVLHRNLRGRAFADPVSINASGQPIAAADFTGDHVPDILLESGSDGVLLINDGHAGFTARPLSNVNLTKNAATGDFDGDGDVDITVPYFIYLNDGHGSFVRRVTNHDYTAAVVADFDEDGRADVMGLRSQERTLTIMPGATMLVGIDMPAGNNPRAGTAGDFNNDGHADFAVIRDYSRSIVNTQGQSVGINEPGVDVYVGDGHGRLTKRFQFRVDVFAGYPITAADLNRDGALDLLVPSNQGVGVVLGNGDGTFRAPLQVPGLRSLNLLGAGDLNGDGLDELLMGSQPFFIGWLDSSGKYTYEPFPMSVEYPWTRPIAFGATSETRASIVIAIDNIVHVLSATAPGQWSERTFDAGDTIRAVQVWREGSQGQIAVITGNASMPQLKIFSTAGAELHRTTLVPVHPKYQSPQTWQIDFVDVDHDGRLDLILSALSTWTYSFHTYYLGADGYISTFRGHGGGTFEAQEMHAADSTLRALTIGDANRDGAIDIVADTGTYTAAPVVFVNDGQGRFVQRAEVLINFPVLIKDLDSDGLPDFLYGPSIAFGAGKTVRYFRPVSGVFARRSRNAPPSMIGFDYTTYDLTVIDLDPPKRPRAIRH
jgi:VCBS repeat protein